MEALGYGCEDTSLAFALAAQMWSVQHPIARFGSENAKQKYLPALSSGELIGCYALTEESAGSDHLALATLATPTEEGYLITGTKRFITLGPIADVAIVFATIDPEKGNWGVTALLADLGGTHTTAVEREKMGLRSIPFGDLIFDGCLVPGSNRIGGEGAGAAISASTLAVERTLLLASQVGAMRRQVDLAVEYAKERKQFGQPIGSFQSISNRIADMRLAVETGRLLLYQTAWKLDRGDSVQIDSALLKLHISESFLQSSLDLLRIHGGAGYLTETGVEREVRDSIGGLFYSGTSDIQRVLIARLMGL